MCSELSPLQSGGRQDRFRMWSGLVLKLLGGLDDVINHPHLHTVGGTVGTHPRAPHSLLQSRVMRMNELGICILIVISSLLGKQLSLSPKKKQCLNTIQKKFFKLQPKTKTKKILFCDYIFFPFARQAL